MYKHIVICGGSCRGWPDQLLGGLPNVYLYAANNPSESILAKRRGYGCLVSYNVPPYARAGLYKELQSVRGLLSELLERRENVEGEGQRLRAAAPAVPAAAPAASAAGDGEPVEPTLEAAVIQAVVAAGLQKDLPFPSDVQQAISAAGDDVDAAAAAGAAAFEVEGFEDYAGRLRSYLAELEATLFSEGLHTLGQSPTTEELRGYLMGCFEESALPEAAIDALARGRSVAEVLAQCGSESGELREQLRAARETVSLLERNVEEISGMLRALNGEYVLPAPGGDLIRDGAAVLPTGRNIHALDPYRIPSQTALQRGLAAAEKTIEGYRAEHGEYPETIAVNLWGLEAIKTRGESVAVALGLIGARPVCEATGRVARYELIPLQELGRPRVDALCSLSGIFRDSFANIVELLDDALARAAQSADEPVEQNFVRKHYLELLEEEEDEEAALSRIFSNAAGEFGSLVNERVVAGTWERDEELGETWASRNAFAFGRQQKGVSRAKVLDKLMSTSGSLVQLTDSVEYGLTDIQEYYANSGAMVRRMSDLQGRKVDALVVDTTQKTVAPRKLDSVLRMEYRTKLLNPKWAEAMVAQGSGGAFEVSQRMTALLGWGGTTRFAEDWVWDQSAARYVLDEDMARRLKESNPEAFRNIVGRLLEAQARNLWNAPEDLLERSRDGLHRPLMSMGSFIVYIRRKELQRDQEEAERAQTAERPRRVSAASGRLRQGRGLPLGARRGGSVSHLPGRVGRWRGGEGIAMPASISFHLFE
ncbi:unnamed protein product [Durusdinium trenchii]|uniref:CobN/magnesium chelatase domain-containing protein n=1 Tax=Durusdinium trenchii TaxID=1381693 RepID=A0ABP0NI59_9DINO